MAGYTSSSPKKPAPPRASGPPKDAFGPDTPPKDVFGPASPPSKPTTPEPRPKPGGGSGPPPIKQPTPTPPKPVTDFAAALTGSNRDAFIALNTLFTSYGLGSLAPKIYEYIKNGYSSDTISLLLQDTPEYKARFAANADRVKAGLPALSPADYLATESSYRQIMRQSGLPSTFYDQPSDFKNFISADVSPTELSNRVDLAKQATALATPSYKQALNRMGIDDGHLAAYFLDPTKALPLLQKAAATAAIGSEALQRGFEFNQQRAGEFAAEGITQQQAASGYAQIGSQFQQLKSLASIYGGQWNQQMAEEDVFTGGMNSTQQKNTLINNERANFSGAAGGARGAFANIGGAR